MKMKKNNFDWHSFILGCLFWIAVDSLLSIGLKNLIEWIINKNNLLMVEKLPEKLGDKIASVNARQAGLGVAFQGMAIKAIQEKDENGQPKIKPVTIDEVRLLALTGVTIERQALNLEKNNNQPIAIQINFGSPEVAEWGK